LRSGYRPGFEGRRRGSNNGQPRKGRIQARREAGNGVEDGLMRLAMSTKRLPDKTEAVAVQAATEERKRIARALHDSLGYALTLSVLQLGEATELIGEAPRQARALTGAVRERLVAAADELRAVLASLREVEICASELQPAFEELFSEFAAVSGILVHARIAEGLPPLTNAEATALFRTAQEAMVNSFRHGRAGNVWVDLEIEAQELVLAVKDDGQPIAATASSGFGLLGVKERADALGGSVSVVRPAEGGVAVTLRLPIGGQAHG